MPPSHISTIEAAFGFAQLHYLSTQHVMQQRRASLSRGQHDIGQLATFRIEEATLAEIRAECSHAGRLRE
jgi:hypothetical protein